MADVSPGELQTLIATLQGVTQQLGNIAKAISGSPSTLSNSTLAQIGAFASDAAAATGGVPLWGLYLNNTTTPWTMVVRHV